MRCLLVLLFVTILVLPIHAQDDSYKHAQGHNDYRGWASTKTQNCCNNQDCHYLEGKGIDWDEDENGTRVLIEGQWCPVSQEHWVVRGKSPNWDRAHACIQNGPNITAPPCQRLLCFMGVPNG